MRCSCLQGNLKAFTGPPDRPSLVDELVLAVCEHHTALEHLCLQQQFNSWSVITSSLLQQPHADSLRAFPVSGAPWLLACAACSRGACRGCAAQQLAPCVLR